MNRAKKIMLLVIIGSNLLKQVQAGPGTEDKKATKPNQTEKKERSKQSAQAKTTPTVTAS